MQQSLLLSLAFLTLFLPACRNDDLLTSLSPELSEVEDRQKTVQARLDQLGMFASSLKVPEVGYLHQEKHGAEATRFVQVDLRESQKLTQIALFPVLNEWNRAESPDYGFPKRFQVDVSDDPEFRTAYSVATQMDADFPDPGIAPVTFPVPSQPARYVRLTVHSPLDFALSELMVLSGNRNVARGCPVITLGWLENPPRWSKTNLTDGRTPQGPPIQIDLLPYDGLYAGPTPDGAPSWMGMDLREVVTIEEVRLHPVHTRFGSDIPGYGFPTSLRLEAAMDEDFTNPVVIFTGGLSAPWDNTVTLDAHATKGRYVRVVDVQSSGFIAQGRFALSEMEVYVGGINVARKAEVMATKDPNPKTNGWPLSRLNDGYTSFGRLMELPDWLSRWTQYRELKQELATLNTRHAALMLGARQRVWWLFGGLGGVFVVAMIGVLLNARRQRRLELHRFRTQLANDFHDEIGSSFAAIAVMSENASIYSPEKLASNLEKINRIIREAADAMRETLWLTGSRSELVNDLMKQMQLVASRMFPKKTVKWLSVAEALPAHWSAESRRQVFLFYKETLSNIVRHSYADTIELSVRMVGDQFELEVKDNGQGFQPDSSSAGLGLKSLRQRADAVRGTMNIETTPGVGTHVVLRVPIPPAKRSFLAKFFHRI